MHISSPYGTIGPAEQTKHGFGDVVTLHAIVDAAAEIDGTDVAPTDSTDADVTEAMGFFLEFDTTAEVLEATPAGQVPTRPGDALRSFYARGVRVAADDGLLYNVIKVDAKVRRAWHGTLHRRPLGVHRSDQSDLLARGDTDHVEPIGGRHGRVRQGRHADHRSCGRTSRQRAPGVWGAAMNPPIGSDPSLLRRLQLHDVSDPS